VPEITLDRKCNVPPLSYVGDSQGQKSERTNALGLVMDIRDLTFEDETFDVAIDKGEQFEPGRRALWTHIRGKVRWTR
jgi:hypothetical protein